MERGKGRRQRNPHTYSQEGFSRATSTDTRLLETTSNHQDHHLNTTAPPPSPFKIQEGLTDTTLNRATTPCSHLSGQHHPWLTQSMVNTVNTAESHFLFSNCLQAQLGKAVGARLLSTGTGVQEEGLLLPQLCKEQNGDGASWAQVKHCGWGKELQGCYMPTKEKDDSCWKARLCILIPTRCQ